MMGLPGSMIIECLEVYNSPGFSIVFWSNHHPTAPFHWVIDPNWFQNTQAYITIQAALNSIPPV